MSAFTRLEIEPVDARVHARHVHQVKHPSAGIELNRFVVTRQIAKRGDRSARDVEDHLTVVGSAQREAIAIGRNGRTVGPIEDDFLVPNLGPRRL